MEDMSRNILVNLSLKYHGDWDKIYEAICKKEVFKTEDFLSKKVDYPGNFITILDEEYPPHLKNVCKPPFVLFYYGDISLLKYEDKCISVVGSRQCTEYGTMMTEKIVRDLCDTHIIVSGLALGIDRIASETAINNGGKTIVVLPCGIDVCYPLRHKDLYEKIKKNHLVISEYPLDTNPEENNFRFRNRIVAALGKGLLVTEAYHSSGTLISVGFALMMSKDVMCVPYHADENSECNRLINEGAFLVQNADDVRFVLEGKFHEKKFK